MLRTHDRQGKRIDMVDFHPAYHALMRRSVASGLHSSIWENGAAETGRRHQVRAARFYLTAQLETGHLCPITMTSASLAALMASPQLFREWAPRITTRKYDQSQKPPVEKTGLTLGMGMTEKQGGTDVRANTTKAERAGSGFYRLTGHKWFMSAPMSDAFLALAQAGEGLSCFLVPRILGDGTSNGFRFQRLKDKLGNRSNASSEVEFVNAIGQMVGEPGAGIKTIMDMVTLTRLDCAVASSGLMRAGLAEAIHHTRHRLAFGQKLVDQPVMQRVLADMALDVAGASALSFRLARSFDEAASNKTEASFARAMTPVVKYWVCKIAPALLYEAMECLGGNGYVEEMPLARYYREAPVNAIWEGSGNVMALDVLRVLGRAPGLFDEVLAGIEHDLGAGGPGTVAVLRAAMQVASSRRRLGAHPDRATGAVGRRSRTEAHGGRTHRRRLHRNQARRPVAHDLRHARRAPRRAADHRHALSADKLSHEPVNTPGSGHPPPISVNLNEWFTLQAAWAKTTVNGRPKDSHAAPFDLPVGSHIARNRPCLPEGLPDALDLRRLGAADGNFLGLVLPVAERHEFRLRHADPAGARPAVPALRADARRRAGDDPAARRQGLHPRYAAHPRHLGVPAPAGDRRVVSRQARALFRRGTLAERVKPVEHALQDEGGGRRIDLAGALLARKIHLDQRALRRHRRQPFVPEHEGQVGQSAPCCARRRATPARADPPSRPC